MNLSELGMLLVLSVAVGTDLCQGKIYNRLLIVGGLWALVVAVWELATGSELAGFGNRMLGMLVPGFLLFPIFSFGVLGGGDVKLLCMLGAFVGARGILSCMLYSLVPAAVYAVVVMACSGSFFHRMKTLRVYMHRLILGKEWLPYENERSRGSTLCVSVPILIGVWMYLYRGTVHWI